MDRLDAQQFLAGKDISCAVLGNMASGFLLVDLSKPTGQLLTEDQERDARARGFSFCGTLAFVDGACVVASEPDSESAAVCASALPQFCERVTTRLQQMQEPSDWAEFIEGLYRLPDTRN